jgi:acid phosphatase
VIALSVIAFAQIPESSHVVMVVEENHSYSSVIGNKAMPYLNSLASKYGLATQYYANTHPAIGNSFEMTTGLGLTNDDTATPASFPVSADNIASELMVSGKTWKSYAEGLPYAGYIGGNTGNYAVRNNPFAYFKEVQNSSTQKMNLVPFSQFATDLANNELPNFSYVVPSTLNDGQRGSLQQSDTWLKQNIEPLLADATFQQDGILIITFADSSRTDTAHGGGRVATLVIGPEAQLAYSSTTFYQHPSLLRTVLTALGATSFPGAAASAPSMSEFFTSTSTLNADAVKAAATTSGVTISSPTTGATVSSPVTFVASAASGSTTYPITAMRIYVDNTAMYTVGSASINTSLALASGAHNVTVVAWDKSGKSYTKSITITVAAASTTGVVTITSPVNGASVSSPVQFIASGKASSGKVTASLQILIDSVSVYSVNASTLNTSLSVASGAHTIVIQAKDNTGTTYSATRYVNVTGTASSLAVSPSSVSFGSVSVGSSATQTVTMKASTAAVTVSQVTATSGFTVSGVTLPLTIAAGQSASFSVKFTPTVAGAVSGSVSVASNASNSTVSVGLSGTGAAVSGSNSVTLTWTASTSSSISGYNVYRGTVSGGPYTKLTSSVVSGDSYKDSTVSSGTTYYYVVTAVSTTGSESGYSAPATATVP